MMLISDNVISCLEYVQSCLEFAKNTQKKIENYKIFFGSNFKEDLNE